MPRSAAFSPDRAGRLLLIASLVLNIFLAGAIAGGVWRWTHGGGHGGWRVRAVDALPPASGEALRQAMRATVRDARPLVRAGRAAREQAAQLFVQPQFDAPGVLAQLDRARAADQAIRIHVEQRIVSFAATLPLEQRRILAGALRAGPLRDGRRARAANSDGSPPGPR